VLYLAVSPCGENVVTGSGDETLRFWKLFPSAKRRNNNVENQISYLDP
jgi:cell division cycle 20-like protein 1 (cofactor of APC complex)